jgi:hypothetical protein
MVDSIKETGWKGGRGAQVGFAGLLMMRMMLPAPQSRQQGGTIGRQWTESQERRRVSGEDEQTAAATRAEGGKRPQISPLRKQLRDPCGG